jgi:hypothetical protein
MTTPFPFVAGQVLTAAQLNDIQNLPISDKTADYVLVVGDVTKRTIMNSASATTITVDDAIFTVGDVIQVANKGAGVCTITAGAGVTINTSGSLDLAQYGGGYLLCLSASTFTFFNLGGGGASYGTATGGSSSSITIGGENYTLLTFTSDGTLTVTKAGLFDVLLIGGGGGSGAADTGACGGGGGGDIVGLDVIATVYFSADQTVDVGAGGAAGASGSGARSTIGGVIAIGGGRGGYASAGGNYGFKVSGNGGSGGGSCAGNLGDPGRTLGFFAQLDENNVVTTVHCVTQQFLEANPDAIQALGLKHFLTQTAKPTQALATHTTTTHKTLRHHHQSSQ